MCPRVDSLCSSTNHVLNLCTRTDSERFSDLFRQKSRNITCENLRRKAGELNSPEQAGSQVKLTRFGVVFRLVSTYRKTT